MMPPAWTVTGLYDGVLAVPLGSTSSTCRYGGAEALADRLDTLMRTPLSMPSSAWSYQLTRLMRLPSYVPSPSASELVVMPCGYQSGVSWSPSFQQ